MKKILLLAGLALAAQASADKNADNLVGLKVADVCPLSASFYIDGYEITSVSERLTKLLKDHDTLYGLNFMGSSNYSTCTQGAYIIIEGLELNDGSHVYTTSFRMYSKDGTTKTNSGNPKIKLSTFYDMMNFGIVPTRARFEEKAAEAVKQLFQDFVLDWRKTH